MRARLSVIQQSHKQGVNFEEHDVFVANVCAELFVLLPAWFSVCVTLQS